MKSLEIKKIRKQFHKEWLLIAVDEIDHAVTRAKRGRLLAHSPNRDYIYAAMMKIKELTLVTFSDNELPPGYAVIF